ncbi:hypothetical protein HK102_008479 [Quaeritorhiza haematococci]|nr:hypothetical protein HK102_008479 [Quaeritorhiza haematococci]
MLWRALRRWHTAAHTVQRKCAASSPSVNPAVGEFSLARRTCQQLSKRAYTTAKSAKPPANTSSNGSSAWFMQPLYVNHAHDLIRSYEKLAKRPLLDPDATKYSEIAVSHRLGHPPKTDEELRAVQAHALFHFSSPILSHNNYPNAPPTHVPYFIYGNAAAFALFRFKSLDHLQQTPSRQSAADGQDREKREEIIKRSAQTGYLDGIQAWRVTATEPPAKFWIEDGCLWNVFRFQDGQSGEDENGVVGQAAMLKKWESPEEDGFRKRLADISACNWWF